MFTFSIFQSLDLKSIAPLRETATLKITKLSKDGVFGQTLSNFKSVKLNVVVPKYINILDWSVDRALVNAAKWRLKQNQLFKVKVQRSIESEVHNLVANLNSSLKRLQLLENNVSVAEKSFEITRQWYSDGDIDSQSLVLERNGLNTANTSHIIACINYQLMLADLMRKTFFDFQKNELIK